MRQLATSLAIVGAISAALTCQRDSFAADAQPAAITIDYPAEGSMSPPDFAPPTLLWRDPGEQATAWQIDVAFSDGSAGIRIQTPGERMKIGEIDPRCVGPTNQPPKERPKNKIT